MSTVSDAGFVLDEGLGVVDGFAVVVRLGCSVALGLMVGLAVAMLGLGRRVIFPTPPLHPQTNRMNRRGEDAINCLDGL